jgi:hypothetical protein
MRRYSRPLSTVPMYSLTIPIPTVRQMASQTLTTTLNPQTGSRANYCKLDIEVAVGSGLGVEHIDKFIRRSWNTGSSF